MTALRSSRRDDEFEQHQETLEWLGWENGSEFDPNAVPSDTIDYELALTGASPLN